VTDLESVFAALDPMPPSRTPPSSSAVAQEVFQSVVERRSEVTGDLAKGQTVGSIGDQTLGRAGTPSNVLVVGERSVPATMILPTRRRRTRTLGTVGVVVLITLGAVTTALVTRQPSVRPAVHRPVVTSAWTVEPTPAIAGAREAVLNGVACSDASHCIAVGGWSRGALVSDSLAFSLSERWDGSSWTILPTPRLPARMSAELFAVACPSRNLCIAVGAEGEHSASMEEPSPLTGDASPFVERWDGNS
jgi:hypothetical protein